jgi:hypothetical protein
MRGFLRGLYSANGSIVGKGGRGRVTLKAASFDVIKVVQEMLSALGIRSYYTTNGEHDVTFKNGTYTCKKSYDLNITSDAKHFEQLIGFLQKEKAQRLRTLVELKHEATHGPKTSYEVVEVSDLCEEEVFDITVDVDEHTYWTGGLLVSNCAEAVLESDESCNLQNIALMNLTSKDEFVEASRLMHRWGKRVSCEEFHHPSFNKSIHKNRRIGTSVTGCLASSLFVPAILDEAYAAIQEENVSYSKELGISESIRTTTLNPGGTTSKLMDQHGYEGIHPAYSRYIIQRIRFASNDPLIPRLLDAGHYMEPSVKLDGTLDHGTLVVDFYEKAPDNCPVADEDWDTWKQLDALKKAQKHWCDQSASVTIYYKKDEIPQVKSWISENLPELKTISFLAHSGHGFKQAPKEPISRETYEKAMARLKPLDIEGFDVGEGTISGTECASGACPIR